jgi:hypothetical protein
MERSESESTNTNVGSGDGAGFGSSQNGFSETQSAAPSSSLSSESGVSGRMKSVATTVKQKASAIPGMLADGLEAGAQALRQNKLATSSATDGSSVAASNDSSIVAVTDTLADGMQSSAEWLRDADIEKLKTGVEKQVKEHPARSLLVALGAGYLIGKALRR